MSVYISILEKPSLSFELSFLLKFLLYILLFFPVRVVIVKERSIRPDLHEESTSDSFQSIAKHPRHSGITLIF